MAKRPDRSALLVDSINVGDWKREADLHQRNASEARRGAASATSRDGGGVRIDHRRVQGRDRPRHGGCHRAVPGCSSASDRRAAASYRVASPCIPRPQAPMKSEMRNQPVRPTARRRVSDLPSPDRTENARSPSATPAASTPSARSTACPASSRPAVFDLFNSHSLIYGGR